MFSAGQLCGYAEESVRAGQEGRRVAEGDGILHAGVRDCGDCGCRDYRDCGGGVDSVAVAQDEGCWWREGKERRSQEGRSEEDGNEGCEGLEMVVLVCLFERRG